MPNTLEHDANKFPARGGTKTSHDSVLDSLKALFDSLDDDALIVEFSTDPSLRRFASKALQGLTTTGGYHQSILYYLRHHRPGLLGRLDADAQKLAEEWPMNYERLNNSLLVGGWWATSLRKRFRMALKERMRGSSAQDWVDAIWPAALDILSNYEIRHVANTAEKAIIERLHLPSAIYVQWTMAPKTGRKGPANLRSKGGNQWLAIKKMLRHKLNAHFRKLAPKSPAKRATTRK